MIHAILEDPDKAKSNPKLSMNRACDHTPCGIPRDSLDHHPRSIGKKETYYVMWRRDGDNDYEIITFAPGVTCPACSRVVMAMREHCLALSALEGNTPEGG